MASEKVKLFSAVEMEYSSTSQGLLRVSSDLPGYAMTERLDALPTPVTSTRRQIRFRLPGTLKGHMLQLSWNAGVGLARLYRVRVYARELPRGAWQWYPVFVPETSEAWNPVQIPVPPTSDQWSPVPIPIPETSEQWSAVQIPIPETSDQWSPVQLPVKPTPLVPDWVAAPVDR